MLTKFQSQFFYVMWFSKRSKHIILLQSSERVLDNSEYAGIVFMDLSKAYIFIPYALLIAKLEYQKYGREFCQEYGLD